MQIHGIDGGLFARRESYDEDVHCRYAFPLWTFHRIDLQAGLLSRATELGVRVHYSCRVTELNTSKPSIEFANGGKHHGDLVVVADGTWSTLRSKMLERTIHPQLTGEMAYRVTIERAGVQDKQVLEMMNLPQIRFWVGAGLYAVGHSARDGEQFSLLLLLPDNLVQEEPSTTPTVDEIRERVKGMDPT